VRSKRSLCLLCLLGLVALRVFLFHRSEDEDQGQPLPGEPIATTLRQTPGVVQVEGLTQTEAGVIADPRDGTDHCPYRVDRVYTLVHREE
jgi:hypothetical protein